MCTLLINHRLASSSFFPLARTIPYRYSKKPPLHCSGLRVANHPSNDLEIPTNSLFTAEPRSTGPKIISLSSSFRFSPDIYLAYKARKRAFWLNRGKTLGGGIELVPILGDAADFTSFDLPFPDLSGLLVLTFGDPGERAPFGRPDGRKTAAQRSNSLQSKKDFARRYLCISLASIRASSGSEFSETTIGNTLEDCLTSSMGESTSVSPSESARQFDKDDDISAALYVNQPRGSHEYNQLRWMSYHFAD